jgi:hypothetical protein
MRQVRVPWELPGSRFTVAFERHAIDVLLEAEILGATRLLRIIWDEAWKVRERAVARGQKSKKKRATSGRSLPPAPSSASCSATA